MSDWDTDVDVVVLGSGGAGLTAALTAATNGASVHVYEKAAAVGGTTAVSGGIVWIPAHPRSDSELPVEDAIDYLRAQSLGFMDDDLMKTFVQTGAEMLDYVEAHSDLRFEIAEGFPDYKPELPGGRPAGGRSLNAKPFDLARLGDWRNRIMSFPADFSNVGIDAETRTRIHASVDNENGDYCVAGTALIAGLLKGLLDIGVVPQTNARAVELIADDDQAITGVRITLNGKDLRVRARGGVVLATGGFEWDGTLVAAYLRGPMRGAVSPPNNTGDGLRMAMSHGADLANMGEAWWVPIVQLPGDTFQGRPRSRSVRLERTRPRSIIVNRAGKRFLNEAGEYNSMAGPFQYLDPRDGYANDPAWIVFDSLHLKHYGFLGVPPGEPAPEWFSPSADLAELGAKTGIDVDGLARTLTVWNDSVTRETDPDFGRGSSAYDGYWGDDKATTTAGKTLGPIDTAPYYAVPVSIGAMGTKGGPRTDRDGRVLHVRGSAIPGLFAAGNAMAGATGKAYGGAGGTLGPAMVFGYRAGRAAAARL